MPGGALAKLTEQPRNTAADGSKADDRNLQRSHFGRFHQNGTLLVARMRRRGYRPEVKYQRSWKVRGYSMPPSRPRP